MAEYLVELYVSQGDHAVARHHVAVAERAGADLTREGRAVRYLQSFFVPEDETCFLLYEADSVDLVTEAVGRAGLRLEHVSAATTSVAGAQESPGGTTKGTSMTSTTTSNPDLTELRDKQQKVWSSGDYNKIAALTVPVSEHLVDHVGVGPNERVLDVATGTGHVALAAARRSAESVGIDYVPELLEIARRRAEAEDLVVELAEADAEHLPQEDASFDVVLSAIGVMFAADHDAAARELVRVTRPGGRIGLASWTPEGFVGGILRTVGAHVSPPPGAQPATRWGTEEVVAGLLGDGVTDVSSVTATVTQRFTDGAAFADLFLTYYGPTFAAASRLDDQGRAALRADLIALAESHDRGEGDGLVCDWEYRIVTATRR
ncbi:ubiquinone/menaquinone biosynthesis C-methylase UbiE [Nocardioides cavernae]|nr:methyltransferase domain-containing protein [Nocardioides cavernae]MBM7512262.1 ubiquinone/menaquinone biosynthesis C-methylase UbiE [Nocardioides cavernae]